MPTIFSTSPHFDDYDETKQFVRILFRPGRAVQARELTQLQTIIQAQVERFGKGIYKEGSFITPPETTFDNTYSFVKLTETTATGTTDDVISGLVGSEITNSDGVKALIIDHAVSTTAGDPPTLFVKYQDGGSNKALAFSDGDTLTSGSETLTAISSGATGNGVAFSVGESIIFAKGNFLFVNKQTHVVSKYSSVSDKLIGFNVTESIVDSQDDTSLLDPATGTFNFFAPGADRYKANLSLTSRDLEFTSNVDPNFIEIARLESGKLISLKNDPQYSVLGDTIARRTFDESGNYIVDPFEAQIFEHLRTSTADNNIAEASVQRDGIYFASDGGNEDLFVSKVQTGRAYVSGYEVKNFNKTYLTLSKARNNTDIISSIIPTSLTSYVKVTSTHSLPNVSSIINLSLRDAFKSSNAGTNGDVIGTAKARGLVYTTGNVASGRGGGADKTAEFDLHLFDVNMNEGSNFQRDVKQISSDNEAFTDFSANIVSSPKSLTGAITFNDASTTIRGSGTKFQSELKSGDTINVSNSNITDKLVVSSITDDVELTVTNAASINLQLAAEVTYATFTRDEALINDADKDSLVFKLPQDNVKDIVDDDVTYSVKRLYEVSLSSGQTGDIGGGPLTSGETWAPLSTDNYAAVITSGGRAGEFINIQSSSFTRSGDGRTLSFDFSSEESLSTETVAIYTTINKASGSGNRLKSKSLQTNQTIDITDRETAQKAVISLAKADGYRLNSVKMANVNNPFGGSYVEDGHSNITARYTFDDGQKSSFYDVAKIKLIPGQAKPTHPIRINFDYFDHGATGDYFSVSSYSGINYKEIPDIILNQRKVNLRDCIDFRPRINDAGTGFSGTGTPTNQPLFLDPEIDFSLGFRHYLPKISSIGLDSKGDFAVFEGVSQLNPVEPDFPSDMLKLFVIEQNAYVYNIIDDIKVKTIPNRRFTMKDIGAIENRVRNIEYYTTLNLLERDANQAQIQDALGFERFKNGFIVDAFTGHGVGDSIDNPDYATSINFKERTAGPLVRNEMVELSENEFSDEARSSNNYVLSNDVISLPFTEEVLIQNPFASKTHNLNPFNLSMFQGIMGLTPPGDFFFDDTHTGTVQSERLGTFDSLKNASLVKKDGKNIFGSINDLEILNQGVLIDKNKIPDNFKSLADVLGALSPNTSEVAQTGNDLVKITNFNPKMRDATITFSASGLRPNTTLHAFFDGQSVDSYVKVKTTAIVNAAANVIANSNVATNTALANAQHDARTTNLFSDETGTVNGIFYYRRDQLNLNVEGDKIFRLTNSSTNDKDSEITFAEAKFFTGGVERDIFNEVLRPKPIIIEVVSEPGGGGGGGVSTKEESTTIEGTRSTTLVGRGQYIDLLYDAIPGRPVDPSGRASHPQIFSTLALDYEDNPFSSLSDAQQMELSRAAARINFIDAVLEGIERIPYPQVVTDKFTGLGGRSYKFVLPNGSPPLWHAFYGQHAAIYRLFDQTSIAAHLGGIVTNRRQDTVAENIPIQKGRMSFIALNRFKNPG